MLSLAEENYLVLGDVMSFEKLALLLLEISAVTVAYFADQCQWKRQQHWGLFGQYGILRRNEYGFDFSLAFSFWNHVLDL
ncbi:hypothetical protein E2542_SST15648 [Spatholobus suberectus]|nr:hypothetical protein E2542_SST15648 [Spatholobus suberectus]